MKPAPYYPPQSFTRALERIPDRLPRLTVEIVRGEFAGCRGEITCAAFVNEALDIAYVVNVVSEGVVYPLAFDAEAVRAVDTETKVTNRRGKRTA